MNSQLRRRHSPLINPVCVFKVHPCPPEENRDLIPPFVFFFFFLIRHSDLKTHPCKTSAIESTMCSCTTWLVPFICSTLTVSCNIHQKAVALSVGPLESHNPSTFCFLIWLFPFISAPSPPDPPFPFYSTPSPSLLGFSACSVLANDAFNLQGHCLSFKRAY